MREVRPLSYKERLAKLDLPSMKDRAKRGDLIEAYKILTNKLNIDPAHFFDLQASARTRGHHLKLKKRRAAHHYRKMFFANRIVNPCNKLPEHVVSAQTVKEFKKRLDQYWATKS